MRADLYVALHVLVVLLIAVLLFGCAVAPTPNAPSTALLTPIQSTPNAPSTAHLIPVQVIEVSDGDTLKVLYNGRRITIRLDQIDAPEKRQPFGLQSRESLRTLCLGALAAIEPVETDRYGRTVARVECAGVDAGREQLRTGHAWVYWRYAREVELFDLQTDARRTRAGLWADPAPVPPWQYRQR